MGLRAVGTAAGVAVVFVLAGQSLAGDATLRVEGWKWCRAQPSPRCVTADSLHAVPTFGTDGTLKDKTDLSGVQPSGRLPFDADYNLVALRKPDGTVVWIQSRLLNVVYCDQVAANAPVGSAPTRQATSMGSGADCGP